MNFIVAICQTLYFAVRFANQSTDFIEEEMRGDLSDREAYTKIRDLYISMNPEYKNRKKPSKGKRS